MVRVTIVGLGQIGTSIGLALKDHKEGIYRIGHDRELSVARQAEKLGALDKVALNLPNAIREADLVLLCLPVDQIRETLVLIAADMKEDAVVMDTSPLKEQVSAWAKELLPPRRYYIGLAPVISPAYIYERGSVAETSHADLFSKGLVGIVAPSNTPSEAIKLAIDLVHILGSEHLFIDPREIDSLMAATQVLPQLLAVALLNFTVEQPGWREGRKVAGRAFAQSTEPLDTSGQPGALISAALLNQDNILRVVDGLIATLQELRNEIKDQDADSLHNRLERARQGRETWWRQRQAGNWGAEEMGPVPELPKTSERFGRLIGMGGRKQKPKN